MPSLILTGYPASGKTTVAQVLKERALQHPAIQDVVIINEESDGASPFGSQNKIASEGSISSKNHNLTRDTVKQNPQKLVVLRCD